jgi:hypothetical protein
VNEGRSIKHYGSSEEEKKLRTGKNPEVSGFRGDRESLDNKVFELEGSEISD